MPAKYLRTSDLARAVGVHPNTVRRYLEWGLIPPVERSPCGYRLFTRHHLNCLRLARTIFAAAYPGRDLRASGRAITQRALAGDWLAALEKARAHLAAVKAERKQADTAADLLEHWAHTCPSRPKQPLADGRVHRGDDLRADSRTSPRTQPKSADHSRRAPVQPA